MSKCETGFSAERSVALPQAFLELMRDSPLTGDLYIHSLGHVAQARRHRIEREHGDDASLFLYCTWGRGAVRTADTQWEIGPNQYMAVPAGVPFACRSSDGDPWSLYWVRFDGPKASVYAKEMGMPLTILPSVDIRTEQRIDLFETMYTVLCGGISIDRLNYANVCLAHFLSSFLYADLFRQPGGTPVHADAVVSRATHFMNENIERKLTLRQIASHVGYSESYFYRKFYREMEMAPIDYFIRMKISKASVYLIKSPMTVAQIAGKLGFSTPDYFSRTFTRIVGISATEFRRQNFRL